MSSQAKFSGLVYEQMREHTKRVSTILARSAVIVAGLFGMWVLVAILRGTGDSGPPLTAEPLNPDAVLGIYGLLAAVTISVRMGVRPPPASKGRSAARQIATNQFLGVISWCVVPATFLVSAIALIGDVASGQLDVVRTLGIIAATAVFALLSAEASLIATGDLEQILMTTQRKHRIELLERIVREDRTVRLSRQAAVIQWLCALVVAPVLLAAFTLILSGFESFQQFLVRTVILMVASLLACLFMRDFMWALLAGDTSTVVQMAVLGSLVALAFAAAALGASLSSMINVMDVGELARDLLLGLSISVGPMPLMALLSRPLPFAPRMRGIVYDLVIRRASRELRKLNTTPNDLPQPPFNRFAILSVVFIAVVPLGILLAVHALSIFAKAGEPQRGKALAKIGLVGGTVFTVALVAMLAVLAVMSPTLVWCDSSASSVCLSFTD